MSLGVELMLRSCGLVVKLLLEGCLLLLLLLFDGCLLGLSCGSSLCGCLGIRNIILGLLLGFNFFGNIQLLNLIVQLLCLLYHISSLLLLQEKGDLFLLSVVLVVLGLLLKHLVHLLCERCNDAVREILQVPAVGLIELTRDEGAVVRISLAIHNTPIRHFI